MLGGIPGRRWLVGLARRGLRLACGAACRRVSRPVRRLVVVAIDPTTIGRSAAGGTVVGAGLAPIGERARSRSDAVRGDGDADLARRRRPGPGDLDERGTGRDAEHQPKRQEGELARGHVWLSSSVARFGC
jgi:hypothetical protein